MVVCQHSVLSTGALPTVLIAIKNSTKRKCILVPFELGCKVLQPTEKLSLCRTEAEESDLHLHFGPHPPFLMGKGESIQ